MLERQKVEVLEGTRRPLMERSRLGVGALALVALGLFALIVRDVFFPPAPAAAAVRTATVAVGNVSSNVTATGTIEPQQQQNVNFRQAGQLVEVDVKVGDRVKKGQVLAKIDSTTLQNALSLAQANLAVAQANLQAALAPVSPEQLSQLQHALSNAQQSYNDTLNQVNLTNSTDSSAITNDQIDVTNATNNLNAANIALAGNAQYQIDLSRLANDQAQLASAQAQYQADGCVGNPNLPPCATDWSHIQTAQTAVTSDQHAVDADRAPVNTAQGVVNSTTAKLNTDLAKQQSDQLTNQSKLNSAANQITSAQDQLAVQTTQKPNTVAAAQASVQSAQATVDTDNANLAQATLVAPSDGVVLSLNGQVGESMTVGSGATPQAPGSNAPLPSTSSSSTTGTQGSSGSSGFLVLANDVGLQAVVPFAEADAAKLKTQQTATVTFDAVSGLSLTAHVLAVAAGATVTSNVVNYLATLTLDTVDPRIKQGMTANVNVTVATATNVLTVQNAAITHRGQVAFVTVLQPNGQQVQTLVQTGVVGDQSTEITSGLLAGQKVVLPTLKAPTSTNRGTGSGINIGGGGGGARGG